MEGVDQSLISILETEASYSSFRNAMKDLNKLAGVISELGQGEYFNDPVKTHHFFIIVNEEALERMLVRLVSEEQQGRLIVGE